jgi:methionyl-tRNA formyltransferase
MIVLYSRLLSILILQDTEVSVKSMQSRPRVVFFGMLSSFSIPSLKALLESGIEVGAVVLPASRGHQQDDLPIYRKEPPRQAHSLLPVRNSSLHTNILYMAWERSIPVFEVRRMVDPLTISTLASFTPDMICVACFSLYIPRAVLDFPRLGCLNVHPSLLPDNRGPVPLFWTFRRGDDQTGVTIHFMNEAIDSGDILAQEVISVPDGIDYAALEEQISQLGGTLLAKTVWQLYTGHAVRVPQNETRSNYQPFPRREEYIVPVDSWEARHVYNFIRGMSGWDKPIQLRVGDILIVAERAISYSETIHTSPEKQSFWGDNGLWVRCKTGWVCVITPTISQ